MILSNQLDYIYFKCHSGFVYLKICNQCEVLLILFKPSEDFYLMIRFDDDVDLLRVLYLEVFTVNQ